MSSELIKLLVDIEKNAKGIKQSYSPNIKKLVKSKAQFNTFSALSLSQQKTFDENKEKRKRRTLRSKVTKILNNIPYRCEKQTQQEMCKKWTDQKKRLYDLNLALEKKGLDPINKLNFSLESNEFKDSYLSPKNALQKLLTEEEIALISEDPLYFMHDKKYLKLNTQNNWDKLLLIDPKDPENKKKGIKAITEIDFIEDINEKKQKISKKVTNKLKWKNNQQNNMIEVKSYDSVYKNSHKNTIFNSMSQNTEKNFLKTTKKLAINKVQEKLPTIAPQNNKIDLKSPKIRIPKAKTQRDRKELQDFIKVSDQYHEILKDNIIKDAKNVKLFGVKYLLNKWERKRKVSL